MLSLSQANFKDFIKATDRPVIVKFYADWCKDCRAIRKPAEELAQEYGDAFVWGELDTMVAPEIRELYQVRGIPTFIAFLGGEEIARTPLATSAQKEIRTREELESFLHDLRLRAPVAGLVR